MNHDEPWAPQQHDHNHDSQWYDDTKHGEHQDQSQAVPQEHPIMARNHQEHVSTAWTQAEEAEMLRLSHLGLYPEPSGNTRHNFVFKMKSDGRIKWRTTMRSDGNSTTYDVGSSKRGLWDNFTEVLEDIGFIQCSSMPDIWTRMTDGRLDRVVIYYDDLILEDILTIWHGLSPMKYDSQQHIEW